MAHLELGACDGHRSHGTQCHDLRIGPQGLRTRPWYRNLIYAADENNGYANIVFPSVNEAIRTGDVALVQNEIEDLARRFDAATTALDDAARAVRR
jgi:N-acetylated-alpha-linked acidic dipeptidase